MFHASSEETFMNIFSSLHSFRESIISDTHGVWRRAACTQYGINRPKLIVTRNVFKNASKLFLLYAFKNFLATKKEIQAY